MADSVIITPAQEDIDRVNGYKVGSGDWNGYKNYECLYCQYKTIFLEKMKKHQQEGEHPWAFPVAESQVKQDSSGEPEY